MAEGHSRAQSQAAVFGVMNLSCCSQCERQTVLREQKLLS